MARHMMQDERDRIAQLRQQRWLPSEIARELGRAPSTITRELARNSTHGVYGAAQAQHQATRRRQERPLIRKVDQLEINARVRHGLAHYHSPDEIAGQLKLDFPDEPRRHVSPQTIYTWIRRQGHLRTHWESFLRRRGKRPRKRPENPADVAAHAAIANRPAVIELQDSSGRKHHVLVTALTADSVSLAMGGAPQEFPVQDVGRLWFGKYLLLWKPPMPGQEILRLGDRGESIVWLRDALARYRGEPLAAETSDLFDQDLQGQLIQFQGRHRLTADGVAGGGRGIR